MKRRSLKRKKSKQKSQRIHAFIRSFERLGTPIIQEDIINQIQNGKAEFLEKQSNRISKFRIQQNGGETFIAVYDKQRKVIVTVLTEEMYQNR